MGISKTSDHIQIKIKMPNPSQEPPGSPKAPNEDLKEMDVLCTFKIMIESQNLDHGCIKDLWPYATQYQDAKSHSGSPASSEAPNDDLKEMDVICTFKIMIESQNLDHGFIKDHWSYPNQDQDAKPQSGTSRVLQRPKWGLKGHGCSLHLKNQDREPKLESWMYQRPVTISKSRSRCQTPVRNLQRPPKPQMRT